MSGGEAVSRWDVFVSYARKDVDEVRPLVKALKSCKVNGRALSVFIDEESVEAHDSITRRISQGLANSRVMLVYYSRTFPARPACQRELTAAFLAAHRSGGVASRILVVNPEAGEDHIEPVELRDLRFQPKPENAQQRRHFAAAVAGLAAASPGPLRASVTAQEEIRWWPAWPLMTRDFLGRYAELWRLHSALNTGRFPLAGHAPPLAVAVVSGLPGIGKTSLAQQYAVEFGAAYPGGVIWLSLDGDYGMPLEPAVLAGYHRGLRRVANWAGLRARGIPGERLKLILAEHLTRRSQPCLWIIDGVPAGMPAGTVGGMVIPSPLVHTIITSPDTRYGDIGVSLPLAGLGSAESLELLDGCYDQREARDVRELASDLGGHPLALRLTASQLRAQRGLVPVAQYRRTAGAAATAVAGALADAGETALSVLHIAAALAPGVIPPGLLAAALAARCGRAVTDITGELVAALTWLEDRGVISRHGEAISVHPLVLASVPGTDTARSRAAVATALGALLTRGVTEALEAHIRHVALTLDVTDDAAIPLLRWLAAASEQAGDYAGAGETGLALVARLAGRDGPLGAQTLAAGVAAARCLAVAGEYPAVVAVMSPVAEAEQVPAETAAAARHALARALDGLGRFSEADDHWKALVDALPALHTEESPRWRVDWARALRLRGKLSDAAEVLATVPEGAPPERQVEEAMLYHLRGRPLLARRAAEQAIAAFRENGLEHHPACLEATGIVIDAQITVAGRKPGWRAPHELLAELDSLWRGYSRQYGPDSPLTLAARISHAIEAAGWTSPGSRENIEEAEKAAHAWLGPDHPYRLRALYGLSLAAVFEKDFQTGVSAAAQAYEGQRRVLGEHHPDTLTSAVQLAVARYLVDGDRTALATVKRASRELRAILGPLNFNVWRGRFAQAYLHLPAPVFRGMVVGSLSLLDGINWADRRLGSVFSREKRQG